MGVALLSLQRDKNISDDNLKYTKIATEYVGIEGGGGFMMLTLVGMMYLDSVH